jgi:hypothetical protein
MAAYSLNLAPVANGGLFCQALTGGFSLARALRFAETSAPPGRAWAEGEGEMTDSAPVPRVDVGALVRYFGSGLPQSAAGAKTHRCGTAPALRFIPSVLGLHPVPC